MNNILFVGLNTIDLQFLVEKYPEENSKSKSKAHSIAVGGPATNAAVICSVLGNHTSLCTPIGQNEFTSYIIQDLQRFNIKVLDPVSQLQTEAVFASIINCENNGSRTVYSYSPANNGISKFSIPNETGFDYILIDGFYPKIAHGVLSKINTKQTKVILDGGSWKEGLEELLPYVDIVICSEHFRPPGTNSLMSVIENLKTQGIEKIAITMGEKPIIVSNRGEFSEIAVPKINAVDTLGAGDFFHGAFMHFYANTNNFPESLQKASEIAAESCKSFGTRQWLKTIFS